MTPKHLATVYRSDARLHAIRAGRAGDIRGSTRPIGQHGDVDYGYPEYIRAAVVAHVLDCVMVNHWSLPHAVATCAEAHNVSTTSIYRWLKRGGHMPVDRVVAFASVRGGQLSFNFDT